MKVSAVRFLAKQFLIYPFLAILASCAGSVVYQTSPQPDYWDAYVRQASELKSWSINARAGFQFPDNGGFADLDWKQKQKGFEIHIQGALGSGAVRISSDSEQVVLVDSEGTSHYAQNVDQLVAQVTGWQIPVSGMEFWLRGLPIPGSEFLLVAWDERGHLARLNQNGWNIEYSRFRMSENVELPHKIYLSRLDNEDISIKLVIRHWQQL